MSDRKLMRKQGRAPAPLCCTYSFHIGFRFRGGLGHDCQGVGRADARWGRILMAFFLFRWPPFSFEFPSLARLLAVFFSVSRFRRRRAC